MHMSVHVTVHVIVSVTVYVTVCVDCQHFMCLHSRKYLHLP